MSKSPIPIIAAAAALTGLMLALYFVGGSGGSSTGSDPRSEKKDHGKVSKTKKKSKNDGAGKSNSANRTNDHHPDHDHGVKRSRSMDSTLSDQEFDTEESSTIVSNLTMTSVEGGGEGDACKTSRVPADPETPSQATAVVTKEKKSRIKKQRLKKIHGMLKTTMDYLEQTADADEVITVASSPSFGRKSSAGGRTAVMVSEELAAEDAVDASSSSHAQNVGDDSEVGGGETKVEVEDDQVGAKAMTEVEPQLMPKQEAKLGRSIERSTTGEDAISEGEIDVLDATPEAVAAADEGEVKLHTKIIAEKANAPGLDENNAANEAGLMEQTGDLLDSGAKDAATEQFHVRKSHAKASSEAAPQTKPIAESSGESANASNSTLPVSTYPSEIENANVTEELVAEEAASDVEYVGEVIDPSNPEDGTAELPPENKEPEQLLKETEPKNQQEGQGSPTPLQREETQPKLTQSEPQQQAFPSPETTVATQHQPSASVTTSPSKPIPVKEKEKIVDDEPMEPPTDTTDYSLLKTYWKKQSDKNKFKAPIEDVAAVKSVIAATTLSSPAEKPQQLLKEETQQQKQQQVVVEDSQLILNKGSGSDSSSNSKDGSEEEGYVKVLHSPSGIPMTESELLTSPVVGKEVEVKTEKTKETIEEMTTAKIDEGTEESQGTILEKEEDKAEKSVTKTADEDSPNSFKEGSEPIDITSAEPIKAVEGAKEGAEETDAIPKVDEGKTDNPKIATSNKKKKKKKGKKK